MGRRALVGCAVLGATVALASCGDVDLGDASSAVALEDVREQERTFVDPARVTPPNADFAGRPERRLATRIWFAETPPRRPACRGSRCALILLAHGFGGRTERFDEVGKRLAAAGYVVAAVTFPLTNQDAPGGHGTGIGDTVEQPRDLSFVIDALFAAHRDPADPLYGRIDASRVLAVGHSLGGTTVLAASRTSCCRDERIVATAYVEPAVFGVGALFGEVPSASGPATLTFQGILDFPIPVADTRAFHDGLTSAKILVEMAGGNHVNMIERLPDGPAPLLDEAAEMMIAFFDARGVGGPDRIGEVAERLRDNGHTVRIEDPA